MPLLKKTNVSPPSLLLHKLLSILSLERIRLVFELYQAIRRWVQPRRSEGMYEILDYEMTLELGDPKRKTAVFKKRQRVKFLQDNIIAFQDYAWGEGEVFETYRCTPGVEVDRYQEGDRWNILISLRETKSAGDITDFYIERTARGSFTKDEEWLQTEIRHPTKRLKLAVVFPKKRPCQRAVLVERSRHRTTILGPEQFATLPDGRKMLTWETGKIKEFEIYTIKWRW